MNPLPVISTGLGLIGQGINYFDADSDQRRAQRRLDELSKQPFQRYRANPYIGRFYQTATNMAANPYGYSQPERNSFMQNLNTTLNRSRGYATNFTGGNLGRAINFLDTSSRTGALNDFAASDARLRRSYQDAAIGRQFQGAQVFQNLDNMNTQTENARLSQLLQGYGEAVRSNRDYKRNFLGNLGSDLLTAGVMNLDLDEVSPNKYEYRGYSRYIDPNSDPRVWRNLK